MYRGVGSARCVAPVSQLIHLLVAKRPFAWEFLLVDSRMRSEPGELGFLLAGGAGRVGAGPSCIIYIGELREPGGVVMIAWSLRHGGKNFWAKIVKEQLIVVARICCLGKLVFGL